MSIDIAAFTNTPVIGEYGVVRGYKSYDVTTKKWVYRACPYYYYKLNFAREALLQQAKITKAKALLEENGYDVCIQNR